MIDKELSLIVYPDFGRWIAESQTFKYLHPLDGKEEVHQFRQRESSEELAKSKAQAQLDWFMGDRGNCITEIDDFTAAQLAKLPVEISPETIAAAHELANATADNLRKLGATVVVVTSDANGLPVISYTLPPAVERVTVSITVSRAQ